MLKMLVLGLPVRLLFGYALQSGRFCMYTAFRDLLMARDATLFRAYILALLIQMAIIHGLDAAGFLTVRHFAFTWLAAIMGGSIFGVGISLAGGCASGSWYRIGEGMVGSIFAVLGYGLSVAATIWGAAETFFGSSALLSGPVRSWEHPGTSWVSQMGGNRTLSGYRRILARTLAAAGNVHGMAMDPNGRSYRPDCRSRLDCLCRGWTPFWNELHRSLWHDHSLRHHRAGVGSGLGNMDDFRGANRRVF